MVDSCMSDSGHAAPLLDPGSRFGPDLMVRWYLVVWWVKRFQCTGERGNPERTHSRASSSANASRSTTSNS